jgi:metallophosphoesterase (TIGR00282 family)
VKLLYLGDLVGRSGRQAVVEKLPELRRNLGVDFVIVNGENAASGFGITPKICDELYAAGADAIVLGNHAWDARDIIAHIDSEPRLIRPLNFPEGTPGRGIAAFELPSRRKIIVMQAMGRVFMEALDDPFACVERELAKYRLGSDIACIFVDIHAEATSEKTAFGHVLDGRVSCVFGTHTHVPTADAQVLPGGTAYMSDVGMCGDYDSVIGMNKDEPIRRFIRRIPGGRFTPALGDATICGVYLETDDATGLAKTVGPVRVGGRLAPAWPLPQLATA